MSSSKYYQDYSMVQVEYACIILGLCHKGLVGN